MMKFTKNLEAKIGNNSVPIFEPSNLEGNCYSSFGAVVDEDAVDLPYGDDFMDLDINEIDTRY